MVYLAVSLFDFASNGKRPLSITYIIIPNDHRSTWNEYFCYSKTSGATYASVPYGSQVYSPGPSNFDKPKSISLISESSESFFINIFSNFISLWAIP
jgi:hypothetical protein